MELIPAIDVLNNIVVKAFSGERKKYRPIKSKLINSSNLENIIDSLLKEYKFKIIYVADLNAIIGNKNNFNIIKRVIKKFPQIDFWVDYGVRTFLDFKKFENMPFKTIIGSETLKNIMELKKIYKHKKKEIILSLDFKKYHKKFNLTSIPQIEHKKREQFRKEKKFEFSDKKREQYYKQNIKFFDGKNGNFLVKKMSNFETDINTNHISGSTDVNSLLHSKNKTKLSVCLIADEYLEDFNRCLKSVINNVPNHISYEILIAFNGINIKNQNQIKSSYKSNKNLKYFHIDPACGAGAVRNILIKQSTGENLILLDTSIEITGNIFEEIITDLKDRNIGLTGPFGLKTNDLNHFHENSINKEYVDAIQLYLLALRRNTLMKVGLFRENFRFYRNLDIDFSFQVKNENFKLLSNPKIPIKRHIHSVWENTHEKTRDELSKDNYKRFLTKWKNYKHLLIN